MYSFHSTVWNIENNSQDTIPAFVHFQALQISIVDIHGHEAVFWPSSEQPASHIWRENSVPSLGGQLDLSSWSESMQGWLITIKTWASHNCSSHHWNTSLGTQKPYGQTLSSDALFSWTLCYGDLFGHLYSSLGCREPSGEVRKGLTTASSLSWERIVCEGTVEGSWGRPYSPSETSMGPGLRSWAALLHLPRTPRTFLGDFIPPILASQRRPLRFKQFIFL